MHYHYFNNFRNSHRFRLDHFFSWPRNTFLINSEIKKIQNAEESFNLRGTPKTQARLHVHFISVWPWNFDFLYFDVIRFNLTGWRICFSYFDWGLWTDDSRCWPLSWPGCYWLTNTCLALRDFLDRHMPFYSDRSIFQKPFLTMK